MREEISVPIYFSINENKIVIDEEGIREIFEAKLEQVIEMPNKFLEVENV